MQEITRRIREEARELLHAARVNVVIGYQDGWNAEVVTPCFITDETQVDLLVFDKRCTQNLAKYLVGREGALTSRYAAPEDRPQVAIVASPATQRSIVGLVQEHQFARQDLVILGIANGSASTIEPDVVVGSVAPDELSLPSVQGDLQDLEAQTPAERWAWWRDQFAKCIRCYACRQACPFCYCEECIAEENQPQWIGRSPSPRNNTSWNVIRAYHLVGRCIDCGECERVCPVDIPLRLLNVKMIQEVNAAFDYTAGVDTKALPPLVTFRTQEADDNIR